MAGGRIDQSVHRVQTQAIEVVIAQPHQCVVTEETPDFIASCVVEINGVTPRGVVPMREVRSEPIEIIAGWSEVVVDDIQNHREAVCMTCVDQSLQAIGTAVRMVRSEQIHAVVAPSSQSGKLADWHQLEMS